MPTPPKIALIMSSNERAGSNPSGSWYEELAAPYYALLDAGVDVVIASIAGGPAPIDPTSMLDEWTSEDTRRFDKDQKACAKLEQTIPVAELRAADLDGVFLVGGLAGMWDFPANQPLIDLIRQLDARNAVVASVCHGAAGLVGAIGASGEPLVQGRRIVSWTDAEEIQLGLESIVPFMLETRLRERGADFVGGAPFTCVVQVDGNLITGQNPMSARATGEAIAQALTARMAAE